MSAHVSCDGCKYYLGGGYCRMNLESECAAGEFEMWEVDERETESTVRTAPRTSEFDRSAV